MRVKRYVVDTIPEAMLQIRGNLGTDAVILSTKEIKVGGFMGMFTKKKIEVIAAIEEKQSQKLQQMENPPQQLFPMGKEPKQTEMPSAPVVPRQAAPEAYRQVTQMTSATAESQTEESQTMLNELREVKAMMTRFSRNSSLENAWPEPLHEVCEHLLDQEVERDLLEYWLERVYERRSVHPFAPESFDWEQALREEVSEFIRTRLDKGISKDTKIVYVAGPTGGGKTTTIAKLAAEQLFKHHRKVGFITSDTYRISAVEQLRTYAAILNVPLEVVQSSGDVQRAIQRLDHCDLILMDTAGRNYRNELLVSELQSLLSPIEESETYLVLSMTSKSKDMLNITGHFSKFGLGKVVFTKMDETGSCGGVFNLLHHFPMQLAYITNGQNVPDDLLHPDVEMVTNMLLGTRSSSGDNGDPL